MESRRKKIIFLLLFSFLYSYQFQTGDIIFRKEHNILSDVFAQIDKCDYSHTGVIIMINNKPFVTHIEYDEKEENLKITPFNEFIHFASHYKILRPNFKFSKEKLIKKIYSMKQKNVKFDTKADLNNNSYYCTEYVDYLFYSQTHRHLYKYLYSIKGLKIISVKSLLKSDLLKEVN